MYEYVKQWIAHILHPCDKQGKGLSYTPTQKGWGENLIAEGINRLLKGNTAKIECIEEMTKKIQCSFM